MWPIRVISRECPALESLSLLLLDLSERTDFWKREYSLDSSEFPSLKTFTIMANYSETDDLPIVVDSLQALSPHCFSKGHWSKINLGHNRRLVKVESAPKPEVSVLRKEHHRPLMESTPKWIMDELHRMTIVRRINRFSDNLYQNYLWISGSRIWASALVVLPEAKRLTRTLPYHHRWNRNGSGPG